MKKQNSRKTPEEEEQIYKTIELAIITFVISILLFIIFL